MGPVGRVFDVRDAVATFYRRRRLAAVVVLLTLFGVIAGSWVQYPQYESTVKILVEGATGSEIPFSREQIAFKKAEITQTQTELLTSSLVLEETVRRLELEKDPPPPSSLRDQIHQSWADLLDWFGGLYQRFKNWILVDVLRRAYNPPTAPDRFQSAVEHLSGIIHVEAVPNTDVIALTVRARDPEVAAAIANTIADVHLKNDVASQRDRARHVREKIDEQVVSFRPQYEEAKRIVEEFEDTHEARLLDEQIQARIQEISQLEVTYWELVEAQKSEILSLRMELVALRQVYDPTHPKVTAVELELEEARKRLEAGGVEDKSPEARSADEEYASSLLARINRSKEELSQLTALDTQYGRLMRDKEQEEELYLFLKKKREEAQIAEATRSAGIRVIDPARPALHPQYPRKRINLLLGMMGGLLAAAMLAALLEFLDRSVRTPDDVVGATGMDVIGTIPHWKSRRSTSGGSA
jgi:uncharacterized protein involved in exopolysaccharide biosynthesis